MYSKKMKEKLDELSAKKERCLQLLSNLDQKVKKHKDRIKIIDERNKKAGQITSLLKIKTTKQKTNDQIQELNKSNKMHKKVAQQYKNFANESLNKNVKMNIKAVDKKRRRTATKTKKSSMNWVDYVNAGEFEKAIKKYAWSKNKNSCAISFDLNKPQTFTEKTTWLYSKTDLYKPELQDKIGSKALASEILGNQKNIIRTLQELAIESKIDDVLDKIDYDKLNGKKFVIKNTFSIESKGTIIVKDFSWNSFEGKEEKIQQLKKKIKNNLVTYVPPIFKMLFKDKYLQQKIIIEEYIESSQKKNDYPVDYKFWCFNGKPKFLEVITGRDAKHNIHSNFVDLNFVPTPYRDPLAPPICDKEIKNKKPKNFVEMKKVVSSLAKGLDLPIIRIDVYDDGKNVWFGEFQPLTAFHAKLTDNTAKNPFWIDRDELGKMLDINREMNVFKQQRDNNIDMTRKSVYKSSNIDLKDKNSGKHIRNNH